MDGDESSIKALLKEIRELVENGMTYSKDELYWRHTGNELLTYIKSILSSPEKINLWIPKDYNSDKLSLLESIFVVLDHLSDPNGPLPRDLLNEEADSEYHGIGSFYELAFARCCSMICLILGDRFSYIQKLLIRHLFNESNLCSFFASDLYVFILRIIHPHRQMALCQVIMNMCRRAPREALVKGAALINRIKHPVVNFENPKYQDLLELSG